VGLLPLLLAIEESTPAAAFRMGWLSGFVLYFALLYWIVHTIGTYTPVPFLAAVLPLLLLCAVLALFTGAFAAGVAVAQRRSLAPAAFAAFWWAGLEWVRASFPIGFPWCSLGYTQHHNRAVVQIAEITGVYGVSALVVFFNVVAFGILRRHGMPRQRMLQLLALSSCLVAALQFGNWRLGDLQRRPVAHSLRAALVQGNVAQERKWDESSWERTIDDYARLSRDAAAGDADLIVWPEASAPFYFQVESELAERVRQVARDNHAWLLFGSPAFERGHDGETWLRNRAYLLRPDGTTAAFYDKVRLVPFGEYVPLADLLFFVGRIVHGAAPFEPGLRLAPLPFPAAPIGVLICYEAIFPDLARRLVAGGADLLVNVTNDAWFGPTSAPWQHLAMASLRAIETRVPLLRAANTGISAVVLPSGRVEHATPLDRQVVRVVDVAWPDVETLYTRYGDVFAMLSLAVALLLLGREWLARRAGARGS
jgi:apolipoprotein N-acyltransferase